MLNAGRLTTPAIGVMAPPPVRPPPEGFVPSATFTLAAKAVAVLPILSRAVTCTAGLIATPAVAFVGWLVKTRTLPGAGAMLNALLVAVPATPTADAVNVYPVPV